MQTIVAAVQLAPRVLEVEDNLNEATQLAYEAACKGARLVVLPELCTSGFNLRSIAEAAECCQERDGWQTQAFTSVARQFNCHVVFGYVELFEGKFYNSAAVVGPSGLVANAQKKNLEGCDHFWATPGTSLSPVVCTPWGRLGVLVSRDVQNKHRESYNFFKEDQPFYSRGSVDVICVPTCWSVAPYKFPANEWIELAEGLDANVIVSNRVGDERGVKYRGGSAVISRSRVVQTFGSSFTEPAVVGGVLE